MFYRDLKFFNRVFVVVVFFFSLCLFSFPFYLYVLWLYQAGCLTSRLFICFLFLFFCECLCMYGMMTNLSPIFFAPFLTEMVITQL